MSRIKKWLLVKYYEWKFRDIPDDVCCCGESINHGSFQYGHSPVSAKGYTINELIRERSATRFVAR